MPRRDLITIDGDANFGLNVFETVGNGGANNPGDVITVQAMFSSCGWPRLDYTKAVGRRFPNVAS